MRVVWLGALLAAGGACASTGQLDGQVYRGPDTSYRIGHLGPDWQRVGMGGHNDIAYEHGHLAAVIQVNSSCDPALDIPLEALTRHLFIGFTEREMHSQERIPMAAREALRTHAVAKLDGVPRELLFHVLKKDGCVYDFALVAPPGERFQRARGDYEAFLDGFAARGGGS
jgi:hypothetical protein